MGNRCQLPRCCFFLLQVLLKELHALLQTHTTRRVDQGMIGGNFHVFGLVASSQVEHGDGFLRWLLLEKGVVVPPEACDRMILQCSWLATKDLETLFQVANMLKSFLLMLHEGFPGLCVVTFLCKRG